MENREKFEAFLKDLQALEQKHGVNIGDVYEGQDEPDEIELCCLPEDADFNFKSTDINSVPFTIMRDYGHYVVFRRKCDEKGGD
jgi:hypothetical protein